MKSVVNSRDLAPIDQNVQVSAKETGQVTWMLDITTHGLLQRKGLTVSK